MGSPIVVSAVVEGPTDAAAAEKLLRHAGLVPGTTYEQGGKQYVGVLSGVGGWAGIGLAAGLTNANDGLGAVGGYAALSDYTALGGQLTVFALPN